ncbi:MAG: Alpha/Beta hydrolase protein [Linnemannia gamsii]|nr:MAG: Alpha/Beta hydrolase protein [Linnemannia gamsii]
MHRPWLQILILLRDSSPRLVPFRNYPGYNIATIDARLKVAFLKSSIRLICCYSFSPCTRTCPFSDALAWTRAVFHGLIGLTKYTFLYLTSQTPPTVNYAQGAAVSFSHYSGKGLTPAQSRASFAWAIQSMHSKTGLGTPEQKAQWAKHIKNDSWDAFWIPFQDQTHKVTEVDKVRTSNDIEQENINNAKAKTDFVSQSKVGEGCDLVIFYIHGGGFVQGYALQSLDLFKKIMRKTHQDHGVKVGHFSVEYRLAPEVPFPGGLDDCVNAYKALITEYNIDPKRIVLGGDSAGGNLCYSLALKVRDVLDSRFLPAAIYSSSPYFPWTDKFEPTIFDTINPDHGDYFVDAYTQQRPEALASPYYTAFNASTLAGLPPSLIFWGSVEVLSTWIERFVEKARSDGVKVETMVKPGRSHCWFMIDPMSTVEDREECIAIIAAFLAKFHTA